jgi:hypothetical protein
LSFDYLSAGTTCDHAQVLERYQINPLDFRTLQLISDPTQNMRAPINGRAFVQVYLRGVLVPPSHPLYGYQILADPTRVQAGYTFYKIVFNQEVRLTAPLIEVSYHTLQGFCLKCFGSGSLSDWQPSQSGALTRVANLPKLKQQCLKYILASTNPFNPNLVCLIRNYVGQKFGITLTEDTIAAQVSQALAAYKQIQSAQQTVQSLSPQEILKDITSVVAVQDPSDPTQVYVTIQITGYGGGPTAPLNIALQAGA